MAGTPLRNGDALLRDGLCSRGRIVFADHPRRAANHQRHHQERDADDMRDRQHKIDLVLLVHPAEIRGGLCADQKVVMREHHALGSPRRSGRVDQNRDLPRWIGLHRLDHHAFVERTNTNFRQRANSPILGAIARGVSSGLVRNTRREQHPPGAAVIADLVQFARRQARVGDNRPGVEPARRQQQSGKRNTVLADNDHPIAGPDPQR
ncbi:hypothetical protein ACVWWR_005420 [Bradyrhizobium sp. LM3.2]